MILKTQWIFIQQLDTTFYICPALFVYACEVPSFIACTRDENEVRFVLADFIAHLVDIV